MEKEQRTNVREEEAEEKTEGRVYLRGEELGQNRRKGGKESERARPKREEKSHRCTSTSASIAPPSHQRQHHHRPKIEEEQ